jgi:hypothetical protein
MAGLVPAIHVFSNCHAVKTWMPGTRPAMTGSYIPALARRPRMTEGKRATGCRGRDSVSVMAGQSRPKDGVLPHAYVPAIHVLTTVRDSKTWMPGTRPGMTNEKQAMVLPPKSYDCNSVKHKELTIFIGSH